MRKQQKYVPTEYQNLSHQYWTAHEKNHNNKKSSIQQRKRIKNEM